MNETRFQKWMNAVDDDLLEEAQQPMKKKRSYTAPGRLPPVLPWL